VASKTRNEEAEGKIDVEEVISEIEHKVERLKILYEQYFMGIEKLQPNTQKKEVARKLMELAQLNIRNTALRYRFHALNQKYASYQTYWSRTLREIENGTYYRSIARASRDAARKGVEMPEEVMRSLPKRLRERILQDRDALARAASKNAASGAPGTPPPGTRPPTARGAGHQERDDDSFEETFEQLFESMTSGGSSNPLNRSSPPTIPPSGAPPPRPRPLPAGMDEDKVRELHKRYVAARRALGDPSEIRYEQILSTVSKQGPKILAEHGASAVEFGVVVKDGKVILKATPRK
jgi:hypothetical protein